MHAPFGFHMVHVIYKYLTDEPNLPVKCCDPRELGRGLNAPV